MTKEQYQSKLVELQKDRSQIDEYIRLLKNAYIETNKPCEINTIFEFEDHWGVRKKAIVAGFEVSYDGEVEMVSLRIKKDGNPSNIKVYVPLKGSGIKYLPKKETV